MGAFDEYAFPVSAECSPNDAQPGMTLRDWFAGQALAGYLASLNPGSIDPSLQKHAAAQSYDVADAMMAQRSK